MLAETKSPVSFMGDGALLPLPGRKEKAALERGGLLGHRQKLRGVLQLMRFLEESTPSFVPFTENRRSVRSRKLHNQTENILIFCILN